MNLKIKSAETTSSDMAVSLTLQNDKKVMVGNGIVNKLLKADSLDFSMFRALCSAGGYALSFDGALASHEAGDAYGDGQEYRTKGHHIEADEDVYPEVVQTSKYFSLKVQMQPGKAILLGQEEEETETIVPIDEEVVVDTKTGEIVTETA